jgi:hypothetical protein
MVDPALVEGSQYFLLQNADHQKASDTSSATCSPDAA